MSFLSKIVHVPQVGQIEDFLGAGWHFPHKGLQTQHPPAMAKPPLVLLKEYIAQWRSLTVPPLVLNALI